MYEAAIGGDDLESLGEKFRKVLLKLKLNADASDDFVAAIEGTLLNLNEDDVEDIERAVEIRFWTTELLASFLSFVESQPGCKNIASDHVLRENVANAALIKYFDGVFAFLSDVRDNPRPAEEIFDSNKAKQLADLILALAEFVNRA